MSETKIVGCKPLSSVSPKRTSGVLDLDLGVCLQEPHGQFFRILHQQLENGYRVPVCEIMKGKTVSPEQFKRVLWK